jgi:hypothetical protein
MNIKLIIKILYKFLLSKFNLILKFFGYRLIVLSKKNATNYLEIQNDSFSTISVKLNKSEIIYKQKLEAFIYNETNPES